MENPLIWLIVIAVTAVIEAATTGLVTIWFTIGAIFALIASMLGAPDLAQVAIFLIASALMLIFTRPLVKRKWATKKVRTNADSVIGQEALVIDEIDPVNGKGQVKLNGQVWSAKAADGTKILKDDMVEVLEIKGVHLIVQKIKEER